MKNKLLYFLVIITICIAGCSQDRNSSVSETIHFCKMPVSSYEDMPAELLSKAKYIVLNSQTQESLFKEMDKIVYSSGKLYILDWLSRKIVVFDESGNPVSALTKNGRGPGEYLQITDFDIDNKGNIWIIDGRKDKMIEYSPEMESIKSRDLPYEVEFIKFSSLKTLHLGLSPWNTSKYRNQCIITVDTSLNVINSALSRNNLSDQDYSFPSTGFTVAGNTVLYHRPIDDNVYSLSPSGNINSIYSFDFGNRTVPDRIRTDIERYRNDFDHYNTLVKSVYIDSTVVIGSLMQGRKIHDFIIDRTEDKVYMQQSPYESLQLIGISNGFLIYRILYSHDIPGHIYPKRIFENVMSGNDVLILLKISSLLHS